MDYPAKTYILNRSGKMSKERERVKKKKASDYRGFEGEVGQVVYSRFNLEAGTSGTILKNFLTTHTLFIQCMS
jgi:hypothetical protein